MKLFKNFFKEAAPTNSTGASIANLDPLLFPPGEDDLSQDYQTPRESGQAKWRFSNVWPVMKLTMKGIDDMVDASKEYTQMQNESRQEVLRKNFNQFIEESALKVTGLNGFSGIYLTGSVYNTGDVVFIERNTIKYYFVAKTGTFTNVCPPHSTYWEPDQCSKTLKGCKLRWGISGKAFTGDSSTSGIAKEFLPFGGFPGTNTRTSVN